MFFVYGKKILKHNHWILNDAAINVLSVNDRKRLTT